MFSLRIHSYDPALYNTGSDTVSYSADAPSPVNPNSIPRFQIVRGSVHLYRSTECVRVSSPSVINPSRNSLLPATRGKLLFVLATAGTLSPDNFVSNCGSYIKHASRITFIRNEDMEDCHSLLIEFDDQMAADRFYLKLYGMELPSLNDEVVCHVLFLTSAQFTKALKVWALIPPVGSTELPTCPICIERLNEGITGIEATKFDNSFHCSWVSKLVNSSCRVCQSFQNLSAEPICSICETNESLWMCLICGYVACGRYKEGHALQHWKRTQHCYTTDLQTHWIWDYVGHEYVHRKNVFSACWTYSPRQGEIKAGSCIFPIENTSGMLNSVSGTSVFTAGDHQWAARYYINNEFIALEISLCSNSMDVYAILDITLIDKNGMSVGAELINKSKTKGKVHHFACRNSAKCLDKFIHKSIFEDFLQFNSLFGVISITVLSSGLCSPHELPVPPSNLCTDLKKLLDDKESFDVTFEVEGELIYAHILVLAARSPVFKAEMLGPLQERCSIPIVIQDMKAVVFKAMLCFIYTDLVPEELEVHGDNSEDKIALVMFTQHMLVAADRYELERLKLICEDKLCRHICTDTVATSLTLAEQHNCPHLKKLCFGFAVKPENYMQMTFSEGYVHMVQSCPSLIQEFRRALIKPHS